MLRLKNISKHFDGVAAVDDVSLTVVSQEIVCITGGNGAGKTTLFNLITGFERVDKGTIFFKDKDITNVVPNSRAQQGIARLFQTPRIFQHLSVMENILAAAANQPGEKNRNYLTLKFKKILDAEMQNKNKASELLNFCNLSQYQNEFASNLSFGEKKLLGLCMLLMNNAELLLLDEIYSGLNDLMISKINMLLIELASQGKTFIIIEHRVKEIENICNRILTMEQGRISYKN
jgi:ABC-type branched-subunit amino acid transport system ATPase component